MPKLTGVLHRLGGRPGDRGAVASLVAVLLAGGVVLGMGALVVDVGLIYAEREELQGGADAAAVAVALACVQVGADCTTARVKPIAVDYAGANARDGLAGATVCGRVPAPGVLAVCPEEPANRTGCLGGRPVDPYVQVRTSTLVDGGTALPAAFAGAVTGTDGVTVAACSRVSWGPAPAAAAQLGVTICGRQFDAATARGGDRIFEPPPVDGMHRASVDGEIALRWKSASDPDTSCGGPDGFLWIRADPSGPTCTHPLRVGAVEYGTESLDDISGDCADVLENLVTDPRPVPVAIYDSGDDGGVTTAGIAMFVVTGWRYPTVSWASGPRPRSRLSELSHRHLCDTAVATFCLYGYFTVHVVPDPGPPAPLGSHYGAVFLRTIG